MQPLSSRSPKLLTKERGFKTLLLTLSLFISINAPAIIDSNNNGISDGWEKQYYNGSLVPDSYDIHKDTDGDGWDNEIESRAGTDPKNPMPPNGILHPSSTYIPAVLSAPDEFGETYTITPAAEIVTWPTIPGKLYRLSASTELTPTSWLPIDEPRIGDGSLMGNGIARSQPDGSIAGKFFWRVSISDIDTDGEGLTNAEENVLGTNPDLADTDGDLIPDDWELVHGLNPVDPSDAAMDSNGDGFSNLQAYQQGLSPADFIGPVNLGFNDILTDYPDLSFRDEHPSDLYDQSSLPGWQSALGEHIEIWNEGDDNPYVELQAHLDAHGVKQKFNMLPGTRLNFILRYKGRYDLDGYSNAFDLKVEGASELLIDGTPAGVTGSTPSHAFMGDDDESEKYSDWHYASVSIATDPAASGLVRVTLSLTPQTTTNYNEDEITYGGFVDLLPVEVSWKALALPGFDNLDAHIDPWNGKINGKRIFPDYKDPNSTQVRNSLELVVKTSPALVGKKVFVKAFDVDDTTSETIDMAVYGDDSSPPVIDPEGKAGNDNFIDNTGLTQSGGFFEVHEGNLWSGGGDSAEGVVDVNGETKFIFAVGMQPGNNYRVVASVIDQTMFDGVQVTDPAGAKFLGVEPSQTGGAPASELLTVWRRLWIENDSMNEIPTPTDPRNDLYASHPSARIESATTIGNPSETYFIVPNPDDFTSFLGLQNGNITAQGNTYPVIDTFLALNEFQKTKIYITGNHQVNANSEFRLYDDDGFGLSGAPLPRNNLVVDDVIKNAYKPAFIEVTNADAWNDDKTVDFYRNHPPYVGNFLTGYNYGVLDDALDAKLEGNEDIWCTSIIVAYQPGSGDSDPNEETNVNAGATIGDSPLFSGNARVSIIYSEVVRDFMDQPLRDGVSSQEYERRLRLTAAHEIGHQPLYEIGETVQHAEDGLMTDGGHNGFGGEDTPFSAKSLKRFRSVYQWRQTIR